ncbi:hypothetical protein IMSAGC019_02083 [Lachnospiraceae bacterium]|nr:hypothetical protein IMSAGC019_02083 [Lachnospiraceae bacterium]
MLKRYMEAVILALFNRKSPIVFSVAQMNKFHIIFCKCGKFFYASYGLCKFCDCVGKLYDAGCIYHHISYGDQPHIGMDHDKNIDQETGNIG